MATEDRPQPSGCVITAGGGGDSSGGATEEEEDEDEEEDEAEAEAPVPSASSYHRVRDVAAASLPQPQPPQRRRRRRRRRRRGEEEAVEPPATFQCLPRARAPPTTSPRTRARTAAVRAGPAWRRCRRLLRRQRRRRGVVAGGWRGRCGGAAPRGSTVPLAEPQKVPQGGERRSPPCARCAWFMSPRRRWSRRRPRSRWRISRATFDGAASDLVSPPSLAPAIAAARIPGAAHEALRLSSRVWMKNKLAGER